MKNSILILVVFFISNVLFAQHVIKGRIIPIPIEGMTLFSFGLGYERLIKPKTSIQLLYNFFRINSVDHDGGIENYHSFVPEFRMYFKEAYQHSTSGFLGLFPDLIIYKTLSESGYKWNAGAVLGISQRLKGDWFMEFYIGLKKRIAESDTDFELPSFRIGLNLNKVF